MSSLPGLAPTLLPTVALTSQLFTNIPFYTLAFTSFHNPCLKTKLNLTQEEIDEELHECARHGDLDILQEMKEQDDTNMLNFNALDGQGNSALHKAAANGHIPMLTYLKEMGTEYSRNTAGRDPLTWAILNKQLEAVQWLLSNYSDHVDVLFQPEFGLSPLSTAHDMEAVDIIEALLGHPSARALENGQLEVDSSDDDEDDENLMFNTPDTIESAENDPSEEQPVIAEQEQERPEQERTEQ